MTTKKPAKKTKTTLKRRPRILGKMHKRISGAEAAEIIEAMRTITTRNGLAHEWDHELAEAASLILKRYTDLVRKHSELATKLNDLAFSAFESNF